MIYFFLKKYVLFSSIETPRSSDVPIQIYKKCHFLLKELGLFGEMAHFRSGPENVKVELKVKEAVEEY